MKGQGNVSLGSPTASTRTYLNRMMRILFMGIASLATILLIMLTISPNTSASFYAYEDYVGNSEVHFHWTEATEENFVKYEIYRNDVKIATINDNGTTKYQDDGVTMGSDYDYRVEVWLWNDGEGEEYLGDSDEIEDIAAGEVHGTPIFDTTWTVDDGPYNLSSAVIAGEGGKLTINTGVTIYAYGTHVQGAEPDIYGITVYGGLTFMDLGTLSVKDSTFHYAEKDTYRWPGLEIFDCSNVVLSGNEFHGYSPGAWPHTAPGIRFDENDISPPCSNVEIYNNEFYDCYYGIFAWELDNAEIHYNLFQDNYYGLVMQRNLNDSEVHRNDFKGVEGEEFYVNGLSVRAEHSSINNNYFENLTDGAHMDGKDSTFYENNMTLCYNGLFVKGSKQTVLNNEIGAYWGSSDGIRAIGDNHTIYENKVMHFTGAGISVEENSENITIRDNEMMKCMYGFESSWGRTQWITIRNNQIHNNTGGILLEYCENFTIEKNEISNNQVNGISLNEQCQHIIIKENTILYAGSSGIVFGGQYTYAGNEWNTIELNVIRDTHRAIYLIGKWDVNDGYLIQDNNTISNNELSGNFIGIELIAASNNTIENNTLMNESSTGIRVDYYYTSYYGMYYNSSNNKINRNRISIKENIGFEINEILIANTTNEWNENTLGNIYPTTLSLGEFNDTINIRGVDSPPEMPGPPDHSSKNVNISNFVEIRYGGRPFEIEFHYTDDQLRGLDEGKLLIWKYFYNLEIGKSTWDEDRDEDRWSKYRYYDSAKNELRVWIENFTTDAIYAPLIPMPVHNIDTEEDFMTIHDALHDAETLDGHTITVDPAYTEEETEENVEIHKKITLMSTTGDPLQNIIKAKDLDQDTISLHINDITIMGFTIKDSTSKRGVYSGTDYENIVIGDCIFSNNYNGIWYGGDDTRADTGTITIRDCVFDSNKNAGAVLNTTANCKVEDSTFKGGDYGLGLQNSQHTSVNDCEFKDHKILGIYINMGSGHSIVGNDFKSCEAGIQIHTSNENDVSYCTFLETKKGIELLYSDKNVIQSNTMEKAGEFGVRLEESHENTLKYTTIQGDSSGMKMKDSNTNSIDGLYIKLTGGEVLMGVDLQGSGQNTLNCVMINDLSTIGYAATGLRLFGGSSHNLVKQSHIYDIESSNSIGLVAGSPLNEFRNMSIYNITTYGAASCAGINVLPYANGNLFLQVHVFTIQGNFNTTGIYLNKNNDNNITQCIVREVISVNETGIGIRFNACPSGAVKSTFIQDNEKGVVCESGSTPEFHWNKISQNTGYGLENTDSSVTVNAENNNWGHPSGPGGAGPGSGNTVSEHVDYDPWTGGTTGGLNEVLVQPGTGTVDSKEESDTEVDYDTDSEVTITTQKYGSNPGDGFDGDIGKYIDVHLDTADGVNELVIKLYYTEEELGDRDESLLRMKWHDGTEWKICSDSGVNIEDTGDYAGYVWVKVRSDSSPSLSEMIGTPFGAAELQEKDEEKEEDGDDGGFIPIGIGIVEFVILILFCVIVREVVLPQRTELPSKQSTDSDMN